MPRLRAISGFGTKGPACFLFEIGGRCLLLDLGQGPDHGVRPDLSGFGPVEAVLVSHAHADHVGSLDLLPRLGSPPVWATGLARAQVQSLAAARLLPRTGAAEVAGIAVETGAAGHAPGAVWMRIGGEAGLLYTGDLCDEGGLYAAEPPPRAAALVTDASYGAADEPLAAQRADLLAMAEASPLFLPAPAGGRGLEMALAFAAAGHSVALCPDHLAAARLLLDHPDWLVPEAGDAVARLLDWAAALDEDADAKGVMIAAGANAGSGLAARLASRFVASGQARVVFTGHVSGGSPAQAMLARGAAGHRRWNVHPRLTALRSLLATVAPRTALAAFVEPDARHTLAAALPGPWTEIPEMSW